MSPGQALTLIRTYAVQGRIFIRGHAWDRLDERNADQWDVRHALTHLAATCQEDSEPGKWMVDSQDRDGDRLILICALEDRVVVVTVF
jgi:hypothetical protein